MAYMKNDSRFVALSVISIGCLILSGCGTGPIEIGMSQSRLDSPEAYGKLLAGRGHLGHRSTRQATLTNDYGTTAVTSYSTDLNSVANWGVGLGLGVWDRIDFDLKVDSGTVPMTQLKFQVLGDTRPTAKEGNFSVSVSAGYGSDRERESGSNLTLFSQPRSGSFDLDYKIYDAALILGYRIIDPLLVYGGVSRSWLSCSGKQTLFNASTSTFDIRGQQTLANLGVIFYQTPKKIPEGQEPGWLDQGVFFIQTEGALSWAQVGSSTRFQPNGSVNVGFTW